MSETTSTTPEKNPTWYKAGVGFSVAAIGGIFGAAIYEIYRSSKAPTQPLIPHADIELDVPLEMIDKKEDK